MIRRLPIPDTSQAREQLAAVLNPDICAYPTSTADLDNVIALYEAYDLAKGAPSDQLRAANLDEALLSTISRCFGQTRRKSSLAMLRTQLMQKVHECPICGIEEPRDLDHHLPQGKFKALAIYARNLVPMCTKCNNSKGATASSNPIEQFIHPYFEALPDGRFLRATVSIDGGGLLVQFGVDRNVEVPELLRQRITYQIQRVKLNERYAREINIRLVNHSTSLHRCFKEGGGNEVRRFLAEQAESEFIRFHANHWSPILLLALRGHVGFCEGAFRDLLAIDRSSAR